MQFLYMRLLKIEILNAQKALGIPKILKIEKLHMLMK